MIITRNSPHGRAEDSHGSGAGVRMIASPRKKLRKDSICAFWKEKEGVENNIAADLSLPIGRSLRFFAGASWMKSPECGEDVEEKGER